MREAPTPFDPGAKAGTRFRPALPADPSDSTGRRPPRGYATLPVAADGSKSTSRTGQAISRLSRRPPESLGQSEGRGKVRADASRNNHDGTPARCSLLRRRNSKRFIGSSRQVEGRRLPQPEAHRRQWAHGASGLASTLDHDDDRDGSRGNRKFAGPAGASRPGSVEHLTGKVAYPLGGRTFLVTFFELVVCAHMHRADRRQHGVARIASAARPRAEEPSASPRPAGRYRVHPRVGGGATLTPMPQTQARRPSPRGRGSH